MIIFSTMLYALGKELGLEYAAAEWENQAKAPTSDSLPCARFLARVRNELERGLYGTHELGCFADIAATSIAKARSRAFHTAAQAKADYWISCDDDVEATSDAVGLMMAVATEPTKPRIVFLPCLLRGRDVVGCKFLPGQSGLIRPVEHSATCAFVANGAAIRLLEQTCQHLKYLDDDGVHRLALFHEALDAGRWFGEDISFCQRAALAGVELVAITRGQSSHAGQVLDLRQIQSAF